MTTEQRNDLLAWYESHVPAMPLSVAKKHMLDLESTLTIEHPEDEKYRTEIEAALKLVTNRVDDLLPKVPAPISQHDESIGNRVKMAWPDHLQRSTMYIHMHLCELLYAWNLNPYRIADERAIVDEHSETMGLTRFIFPTQGDANAFTNHYGIVDFLVNGQVERDTEGYPCWVATFTNRFERDQVNAFLEIYNAAIMKLVVIHDERRRAVSMDNGKYGFITVDHFNQREAIELTRISAARELLGRGYKNLNQS